MKNFMICALGLAALGVGLGVAQSDAVEDAIVQLRHDVADLSLRVSRLEHAGGAPVAAPTPVSASPSASTSAAPTPARTMILVSVSTSDHTDNNAAEIAGLKRQHAALMNTVNAAADQEDADLGQQAYAGREGWGERGWGQAAGGGVVTTNVGSIGRQVAGDIDMKNRYATQAAITKEKLDRLQAADSDPKQILIGHDSSGTIYTLESKFDLERSMNNIKPGDTVTWTGTRKSSSAGAETWFIDSIKKVR